MIVLALSVVAMCGASALVVARDWRYPPVILAAMWMAILLLADSQADRFLPLAGDTLLLVSAGVCAFTLGSLLIYPLRAAGWNLRWEGGLQIGVDFLDRFRIRVTPEMLLLISALALPLTILKVNALASGGPSTNWLINARLAFTDDGQSVGWLGYAGWSTAIAATVMTWSQWATGSRSSSRVPWIATVVAAAHALLSTGRTPLVTLLVSTGGVLLILKRESWKAVALSTLALGMAPFLAVTFLLGKGGDASEGVLTNVALVASAFSDYLLGPLWALDIARVADPAGNEGVNALRFFHSLAASMKLTSAAPSLVEPFVNTPVATNVYTVHLVYLRTGGIPCALAAQAAFGAMHAYTYEKAKEKSVVAAIFFGLMLYPLTMQFFSDQYLSLLSFWLQLSGLVILWAAGQKRLPNLRYTGSKQSELVVGGHDGR